MILVIDRIDSEGRTPLSLYTEKGNISQIQKFLAEGANCESKDQQGNTVFMWAVRGRQYARAKLLLEKGVKTEIKDKWGRTALSRAS